MGCYQEGIAKDSVAGKDVTAHIFEQVFFSLVIEVVVDAVAGILQVSLLQRPVKCPKGHVLFKLSSVSRSRTRRSSTVIAGSSTPSVPSLNPMVGCCSLLDVLCT